MSHFNWKKQENLLRSSCPDIIRSIRLTINNCRYSFSCSCFSFASIGDNEKTKLYWREQNKKKEKSARITRERISYGLSLVSRGKCHFVTHFTCVDYAFVSVFYYGYALWQCDAWAMAQPRAFSSQQRRLHKDRIINNALCKMQEEKSLWLIWMLLQIHRLTMFSFFGSAFVPLSTSSCIQHRFAYIHTYTKKKSTKTQCTSATIFFRWFV